MLSGASARTMLFVPSRMFCFRHINYFFFLIISFYQETAFLEIKNSPEGLKKKYKQKIHGQKSG